MTRHDLPKFFSYLACIETNDEWCYHYTLNKSGYAEHHVKQLWDNKDIIIPHWIHITCGICKREIKLVEH